MKILFEAVNGKKGFKEFKSLKECKCFVLKNKKVIKEAQIMEGPLGSKDSALLHPVKALKNAGKSIKNYMNNRSLANNPKDASNRSRLDVLDSILQDLIDNEKLYTLKSMKAGYDSKGFYIDINSYRAPLADVTFDTGTEYKKVDGQEVKINAISDKYNEKMYLPKLTNYIKKHNGQLPSKNQIYNYFKDVIEKRYKVNLKKQLQKKPISHLSKNDVEDF